MPARTPRPKPKPTRSRIMARAEQRPMPSAKTNSATSAAAALLAHPLEFDQFLAKLAARDRQNVDRHLLAADAEPDPEHGTLWRRLARVLFTLSPHAVTTI